MSGNGSRRAEYGVESICAQLPIAQSTYYEHKSREMDATRAPRRVQRDRELSLRGAVRGRAFKGTTTSGGELTRAQLMW
jgi:hypothetical protein